MTWDVPTLTAAITMVLTLLQGIWALVWALLVSHAKRIHTDIRENTAETKSVGVQLGILSSTMHSGFATKDAVEKINSRLDAMNREIGEVRAGHGAQLDHSVKRKEY